jgi:hypothetical protein
MPDHLAAKSRRPPSHLPAWASLGIIGCTLVFMYWMGAGFPVWVETMLELAVGALILFLAAIGVLLTWVIVVGFIAGCPPRR